MAKNQTPSLNLVQHSPYQFTELNIESALKTINPIKTLKQMGYSKRSGDTIENIIHSLLVQPLLDVNSINWLFENKLSQYIQGGKTVLYDFLSSQNINWSLLGLKNSLRFFQYHKWDKSERLAFIVDDTLKQRSGKKVEAVSSHFDHTTRRHIKGQQVVQLGISSHKGFLPIASHLFVGEKNQVVQSKTFTDNRCDLSKSYHRSLQLTKHQLLKVMLEKAIHNGLYAHYLLGDSWYGCKENIKLALKHDLTAIFMMAKRRTKYRYHGKDYTAKALFRLFKHQMERTKFKQYKTYRLPVEFNLPSTENDNWTPVTLVFSKLSSSSRTSWVLFICTDNGMKTEEILETYTLRWNIEVYFKEVKQYFGFMKEQSWQYAVTYASMHLSAIRYLLFYHLSLLQGNDGFANIRAKLGFKLKALSFGWLSWQNIKPIIISLIKTFTDKIGSKYRDQLINAIISNVNNFFQNALGLNPSSIENLDYADKKGLIN
jgi:hypothetical protein